MHRSMIVFTPKNLSLCIRAIKSSAVTGASLIQLIPRTFAIVVVRISNASHMSIDMVCALNAQRTWSRITETGRQDFHPERLIQE